MSEDSDIHEHDKDKFDGVATQDDDEDGDVKGLNETFNKPALDADEPGWRPMTPPVPIQKKALRRTLRGMMRNAHLDAVPHALPVVLSLAMFPSPWHSETMTPSDVLFSVALIVLCWSNLTLSTHSQHPATTCGMFPSAHAGFCNDEVLLAKTNDQHFVDDMSGRISQPDVQHAATYRRDYQERQDSQLAPPSWWGPRGGKLLGQVAAPARHQKQHRSAQPAGHFHRNVPDDYGQLA